MIQVLLIVVLAMVSTHAHVTMNPNWGGKTGTYYHTSARVPHGTHGFETTKMKFHVPHGVLSVRPEHMPGWDVTIETREIQPYVSHGNTVNTAPSVITYTARCVDSNGDNTTGTCANADHGGLDNAHMLNFGLQTKIGCDFGKNVLTNQATDDATIWQEQHTIWWKTEQFVSTPGTNDGNDDNDANRLMWTATASGTESWSANQDYTTSPPVRPCPYTFIYSSALCTQTDSTGAAQVGMRWGVNSEVIAPAENQDAVNTEAHVIAIIDEAMLDQEETLLLQIQANRDSTSSAEEDTNVAMTVAVVGMLLGAVSFGVVLTLFCWRVARPSEFTRALLSTSETMDSSRKSMEMTVGGRV